MKTRIHSVNGFMISAVVAVLFLSAASVSEATNQPSTEAGDGMSVTNLDSFQRTATDLSFTVGVSAWDIENGYWIISYSIWVTDDNGNDIGGVATYTEQKVNGNIWYVTVHYDGINVPYGTTIHVNIDANQNRYNKIGLWDSEWSYDSEPGFRVGVPDHFNTIYNTTWQQAPANDHNATYAFGNSDINIPITITSLRLYEGPSRCDPCDPNYDTCATNGQLIGEITGPFVVDANSSYEVHLEGIPNTNRYIYVAGVMQYQTPGCDAATSQWIFAHEEPQNPATIPTVSEWGLIVLAAILLAAGAVVIVRRRRVAAA